MTELAHKKPDAEAERLRVEEEAKEVRAFLRGVIFNVEMTVADTEYSQELPPNTKKFLVKSRGGYSFRLAFEKGKVAGSVAPYMTVDSPYWEDFLASLSDIYKLMFYLASATAGDVIEILAWS